MSDVTDLWLAPADVRWESAPDAVRAVCALATPIVLFAALRVWMAATQWPVFVDAYGAAHGLDTRTPAGRVMAELYVPTQAGAAVFTLLVLAPMLPLARSLLRGRPVARNLARPLAVLGTVNALSSLADAVPWWFAVATVLLVADAVALLVLLGRPTTAMHVRPR